MILVFLSVEMKRETLFIRIQMKTWSVAAELWRYISRFTDEKQPRKQTQNVQYLIEEVERKLCPLSFINIGIIEFCELLEVERWWMWIRWALRVVINFCAMISLIEFEGVRLSALWSILEAFSRCAQSTCYRTCIFRIRASLQDYMNHPRQSLKVIFLLEITKTAPVTHSCKS